MKTSTLRLPQVVAAVGLVLAGSAALGAGTASLPYRLAVQVSHDGQTISERQREEVEGALLLRMKDDGCFARVDRFDGDLESADLLLRVQLSDFQDEMDYEISMAYRDSPRADPDAKNRVVARVEIDYRLELIVLPEARIVRSRPGHRAIAHRPRLREDPRQEVWARLLDDLARLGRGFACRKSARKLAVEVDRARSAGEAGGGDR